MKKKETQITQKQFFQNLSSMPVQNFVRQRNFAISTPQKFMAILENENIDFHFNIIML